MLRGQTEDDGSGLAQLSQPKYPEGGCELQGLRSYLATRMTGRSDKSIPIH
jgi:hypothetical protein